MSIEKKTIEVYHCERCGHEWQKRGTRALPASCPRCKSPLWNEPKKEKKEKKE